MPAHAVADVSDRWTLIWHAFFYVMIAVATTLALPGSSAARMPIVVLVAALAAWHWLLIVRPGRGPRDRPRQVGVGDKTLMAGAQATISRAAARRSPA